MNQLSRKSTNIIGFIGDFLRGFFFFIGKFLDFFGPSDYISILRIDHSGSFSSNGVVKFTFAMAASTVKVLEFYLIPNFALKLNNKSRVKTVEY